jgi:hypothetical protein
MTGLAGQEQALQDPAQVPCLRDIGAALSPDKPPDPDQMREIYARYASRLLP